MTDGPQDAQSKLDQLLNELYDEKAQTRIKAASDLGKLGDPEAIPDLAQVYQQDPDKNVRKAAADALRIFRRMEQESLFDDFSDDSTPSTGEPGALLKRLRAVLVILLILTVLGNVGILVSRSIGSLPTPEPTTASSREDLVNTLNKNLADARTDATRLRSTWATLQGLQPRWVEQECKEPDKKFTGVGPFTMAQIDRTWYPDLAAANDKLNTVITQIAALRDLYKNFCTLKNPSDLDAQVKNQSGAKTLVAKTDALSKDLDSAAGALKQAVDNPAPTPTMTFTATLPPSDTPTTTLTPSMTFTPTATAIQPTATATLPAAFTYNGLGLAALSSYRYNLAINYTGVDASNKNYSGGLSLIVSHQDKDNAAQYKMLLSETKSSLYPQAIVKQYAGVLYQPLNTPNQSTYTVFNGVLYVTGSASPNAACTAAQATDTRIKGYSALDEPDFKNLLSKVQLTRTKDPSQTINGFTVVKYSGTVGTETISVYITMDSTLLVKIEYTNNTKAATGTARLTTTLTYSLEMANQDAGISKVPDSCVKTTPTK